MHPTQRRSRGIPVREALAMAGLVGVVRCAGRAWRRSGPRRVVVDGNSMAPFLLPGDRLLVWADRPAGRLREGDIVAFPDPRTGEDRILVKRVRGVTAAGLEVRGDNPGASTDSRAFGPVAASAVIGRVRYRYAPPGRVGRLAPRDRAEPVAPRSHRIQEQ